MSIDRSLYRPSIEEFRALARDYNIVPVWREVLADMETPVSAVKKLGKDRHYFLLESAEHGDRWSQHSFLGVDPFLVLKAKGRQVTWEGTPPAWAKGDDPLQIAEATIRGYRAPTLDGLPKLRAGAVGYLGWDVVRHIERLPAEADDDLNLPDMQLMFTDRLVVFDHFRQVLSVIAHVQPGDNPEAAYEDGILRCEDLVTRLSKPLAEEPIPPPPVVRQEAPPSSVTREQWTEMIERAREYIYAGDIFQVVLSQRFQLDGLRASPVDVYRTLRVVNPSPYMYLLRFGDTWVVGSSPEALVKVDGRQVITHPIAGTRFRGLTPERDLQLEQELLADEKERAEHVMLVDLARNDLGRVCEYGSVEVTKFLEIVRYSHLMHLVSHVTGKLRPEVSAFDVLRASFPAGTASGAPKVRAMEIIDELEPTRRGPYAGVVGYFDFSGNLDTAIVFRTAVIRGDTAYVQAGGGIVADAKADDEYLECVNKASAVLNAIRAADRLA